MGYCGACGVLPLRSLLPAGAKRDGWSAYWLRTGAATAEAGEAGERWRTAERLELQKRKGGEKEEEASELANSPSNTESESCGAISISSRKEWRLQQLLQKEGFLPEESYSHPCG